MVRGRIFGFYILLFLMVTAYFYFFDPSVDRNFYLPCFFYEITGYKCPGCGSQRAFHEILHLNFFEAFKQNALFVIMIPYILILIYTNFKREKYQRIRNILLSNKFFFILLIIIILFGVVRNLL